ncbi:unnamed protein product [Rhodiola kirilowii]
MVLSFKVSKTGTRYKPKPQQRLAITEDDPVDIVKSNPSDAKEFQKGGIEKGNKDAAGMSSSFLFSRECITNADTEVSFTLNLFPDGYSIVKPAENQAAHRAAVQENPKLLHPYDRASETFFAAIESGRLPGDLLNDIPCKYVDGTIVCEVQDYRKCALETGQGSCVNGLPSVHKLCLRMSLENIVKDIPTIADGSWSYRDLMEVESRILKSLQPKLCLDPTPKLDRLCEDSTPKLNLDLRSMRKKRMRQVPEVTVTCHTNIQGKKVCIDRVPESSSGRVGVIGDQMNIPGETMLQQNDIPNSVQGVRSRNYVSDVSAPQLPMIHNQPRYQMNISNQRLMQEHGSGPVMNLSGASPAGQDTISYTDNIGMSSLQGKRENHDGQLSPLSSISKRPRPTLMGADNISQQHIAPFVDGFQGQNAQWKNSMLQQQLQARGIQYTNSGVHRYQSQMFDGLQNQEGGMAAFNPAQGTKFVPKEEQIEMDKLDRPELGHRRNDLHVIEQDTSNLDPQQLQFAQRQPQNAFNRAGFSQAPWNSLGQQMEKREDQLQKRKSGQSPRVSAGSLAQSPLSSKSGEFSSGSLGAQFGAVAAASSFGTSQKDNKAAIATVPLVSSMPYMTSSGNESIQRQQPPKRRTNSLPKTQALSGVASPASVSTTSVPPNVNSPSIGTPSVADQTILERFTKIEMVTNRYNLNAKKNKVDNYIRKPIAHSPQLVAQALALVSAIEDIKDDIWPLSKSIVSGSMNAPKTRVLNFMQPERVVQVVPRTRTRLIMTEKSKDGTVAMHLGDIEDCEFMTAEEHLQTLPSAHKADLLAAQCCSLMIREGYIVEDHIQLKPMRISPPPSNQQVGYAGTSNEMQQYAEAEMNQSANKVAKPTNSDNSSMSSQIHIAGNNMLPPGNQALQMSQGLLTMPSRPQQLDQQSLIQQQAQLQQQSLQPNQHSLIQQQQPQFQRPPIMMGANPLAHLNPIGQGSNTQLGNHMVNKPSPLQMQMLQQQQQQQQGQPQQQQQQQQQAQMQRKLMMGLGNTMGMGNMGNNLVGLGGLGNVINMGTGRGIGGPITGVGNVGQNPLGLPQNANINAIAQQLRNGQQLTQQQQQAMIMAAKMRMYGRGMLGGPNSQPNIAGISGARQMHPSSASLAMLGQSLNRANINPMQQRAGMAPMGPPKLMAGMNPYMNQQQQLQLQQQQQQQQMQQQSPQSQLQQLQQQQPGQHLQQQPAQEGASPLQAVVSPPPPQVSSPTPVIMPQQQLQQPPPQVANPQQMSQQRTPVSPQLSSGAIQQMSQQRTPMSPQLSSGAIHPITVSGNPEVCPPASPQLSSQTLGSVGSISNSPMELQGVNKSNSNA